jgi:hypothetical protein
LQKSTCVLLREIRQFCKEIPAKSKRNYMNYITTDNVSFFPSVNKSIELMELLLLKVNLFLTWNPCAKARKHTFYYFVTTTFQMLTWKKKKKFQALYNDIYCTLLCSTKCILDFDLLQIDKRSAKHSKMLQILCIFFFPFTLLWPYLNYLYKRVHTTLWVAITLTGKRVQNLPLNLWRKKIF